MSSIYELVGNSGGDPLVEHDYRAWEAAMARGDHKLASVIEKDMANTARATKLGRVSVTGDGLPMPIISNRFISQPEDLEA